MQKLDINFHNLFENNLVKNNNSNWIYDSSTELSGVQNVKVLLLKFNSMLLTIITVQRTNF